MACFTKVSSLALPLMILLLLGLLGTTSSKNLQVHMIINSHIDLGWVNTIEEYYVGRGTRYGENVGYLFDRVFRELSTDQNRTYCLAELGFLEIWWQKQNQQTKDKVVKLFHNGQVELINGGWVGNDEATAMYDDIIQNFITGQRWAQENLSNATSSIGWQMDSFGTSAAQAYLLKEAGFDATFFSRVDNDDRQRRKDTQSLQFNWNFPNSAGSLFTNMMARPYYRPILPRARWIAEFFSLNQNDKVELAKQFKNDRKFFNTDHVLFLICGDFYVSPYGETDDIVSYFKNHPEHEIDLFYSNPGRFIKEVKQELAAGNIPIPDKHGDFFPLNEEPGTVWSGFYSSKAAFKAFVRWHSRYLTAAKFIISQRAMRQFETSNAAEYTGFNSALTELEKAVATVQHHDGVSGTMKEHVRFDYEDILTRARKSVEDKLRGILLEDLKAGQSGDAIIIPLNSTYDNLLEGFTSPEISKSSLPANSDLLLAVMNPGNTRLVLVTANTTSIPTADTCITVESSDGSIITPDIICQGSETKRCAIYFTDTIEAYAWMYYQIKVATKTGGQEQCGKLLTSEAAPSGKQVVGSHWSLQIDDGNVFTFLKTQGRKTVQKKFKLSYSYYESAREDRGKHHASGAYIFMPRSADKIALSTENHTVVWTGNHLAVVQIQSANFTTSLQILLEEEQTGFSVVTQLAPINNAPNGCEIVMEITVPELSTDGKFFTDTNGYFMLERPYVPATAKETVQDEVSKNYHPMTTRCSLEGKSGAEAFTVFTDRAQGVAIQKDNQINVMIHRVAVMDDDEGVDELLNEKDRSTAKPLAITTWHYFLWDDISSANPDREETQYDSERPLRIWLFSVNNAFSVDSLAQNDRLSSELPRSLKVNLRTYNKNTHSIRLQNLDPTNTLSVSLSGISDTPSLISYLAQNKLTGVATISETYWTTTQVRPDSSAFDLTGSVQIDIAPLQMRTFEISVGKLDASHVTPGGTTTTPPGKGGSGTHTTPGSTTNTTSGSTTHPTTPGSSTNTTQGSTTHPKPGSGSTTNPKPGSGTNTTPGHTASPAHNTTTNVPDSPNSKVDKDEPTRYPETQEEVSADGQGPSALTVFKYYLIVHICVGVVYFIWCSWTAGKRSLPLDYYKRDILIVATCGPIGLLVLCYLNRDTGEVKHEILP